MPGWASLHNLTYSGTATQPGSSTGRRGSFGRYRAFDTTIAQDQRPMARRPTLPVPAIGGENGIGEGVGNTMTLVADNVQRVVVPAAAAASPDKRRRGRRPR